jgi:hypothetical protein
MNTEEAVAALEASVAGAGTRHPNLQACDLSERQLRAIGLATMERFTTDGQLDVDALKTAIVSVIHNPAFNDCETHHYAHRVLRALRQYATGSDEERET